jgi:hypothetical protein
MSIWPFFRAKWGIPAQNVYARIKKGGKRTTMGTSYLRYLPGSSIKRRKEPDLSARLRVD